VTARKPRQKPGRKPGRKPRREHVLEATAKVYLILVDGRWELDCTMFQDDAPDYHTYCDEDCARHQDAPAVPPITLGTLSAAFVPVIVQQPIRKDLKS